MKKFITIILSLIVSMIIIYPCKASDNYLFINTSETTIEVGKTFQLIINFYPEYITWNSSDASIAEVSEDGKVTAVKPGKAIITAHLLGQDIHCNVTVIKVEDIVHHLISDRNLVLIPLINHINIKVSDYNINNTKFNILSTRKDVVSYDTEITDDNSINVFFKNISPGYTDLCVYAEFEDGTVEYIVIRVISLPEIVLLPPVI